jgi:exodeoxyribonuclease V alpha subunit
LITRIVYRAEDSGYTVCAVRPRGDRGEITVVGNCPVLAIGETLRARGRWVRHQQHGAQFRAESMISLPPATAEGIRRYLAGGSIRGIGKVMAERLVRAFGAETLRVIERESKRLIEVEGIGAKRREMIRRSWAEQQAVREIMVFLHGHGIGSAQAVRIYRQYGTEALAVVRANPYRLCRDVWGIGFKTADRIAQSVGIPPDSEMRGRAGITYLLSTLADEGHCFCPRPDLLPAAEDLLGIAAAALEGALAREIAEGGLVEDRHGVYLAGLHRAETGVAAAVARLLQTPPPFRPIVTDRAVRWAEQRMGIRFAEGQAQALAMVLANKLSILTGGPGVGKTTIVRALVDVYGARGLTTRLAAPTGRAAKRLEEATHAPALTIHRLLRYDPHSGQFEHDAGHPLAGDVFILDEVSMVDVALMHAFLRALPASACLVLVGDADQLPSVGPGNVLRDLIGSDRVPVARLTTVFRQEARSWIVHNAHRVNRGEMLELPGDTESADFFFVEANDPDEVIRRVLALVTERIPARFGLRPREDIQVLTPMRKHALGCENLNALLQDALNPAGRELQRFGRRFREGDRILQVRNNYDRDVFNGDVGLIRRIDPEAQEVAVDFDGLAVRYDLADLDEIDLAYACSVHKAQGSEYPAVVLLLATQHYRLLQRNLLYTAITRGRRLVCLVGSRRAVQIAIRNNAVVNRRTGLSARVSAACRSLETPG